MMLKQKRCRAQGAPPQLQVRDEKGEWQTVKAGTGCKLLGGWMQSNISWQVMIDTGKESLLNETRWKLGALKHLSRNTPRKCRQLLANGFIVSKVLYLISVWGGTEKYTRKIQVLLNDTPIYITRLNRRTNINQLMSEYNWMWIKDLIKFHSLFNLYTLEAEQIGA